MNSDIISFCHVQRNNDMSINIIYSYILNVSSQYSQISDLPSKLTDCIISLNPIVT